jgi:hypothetical protein
MQTKNRLPFSIISMLSLIILAATEHIYSPVQTKTIRHTHANYHDLHCSLFCHEIFIKEKSNFNGEWLCPD